MLKNLDDERIIQIQGCAIFVERPDGKILAYRELTKSEKDFADDTFEQERNINADCEEGDMIYYWGINK